MLPTSFLLIDQSYKVLLTCIALNEVYIIDEVKGQQEKKKSDFKHLLARPVVETAAFAGSRRYQDLVAYGLGNSRIKTEDSSAVEAKNGVVVKAKDSSSSILVLAVYLIYGVSAYPLSVCRKEKAVGIEPSTSLCS